MNIFGNKHIFFQPKIFGIQSLFVPFGLIQHRIVGNETNTAITYIGPKWKKKLNKIDIIG